MRLFSYRNRPFHLGPYPLERLERSAELPDFNKVPPAIQLTYDKEESPEHLSNAIRDFLALLDAIRDGFVKKEQGEIPDDLQERANHLKSHCYFYDVSQAATCKLPQATLLSEPFVNPDIEPLIKELESKQAKTFATGIDVILAELKDTMHAPRKPIEEHTHAVVFLYEYPRAPTPDEPGAEWIEDTQKHRAALRAAETASIIAAYIRLLGYEARGHTASASDIDLNKLAVAAGLAEVTTDKSGAVLSNPYIGTGFGIGAVTTTLPMSADLPLAPAKNRNKWLSHGPAWWLGKGFAKNRFNRLAFAKRRFVDGPHPFETLKRQDNPTTFIDEARVARVPKRADMFARGLFGDLGKQVQDACKNGHFARKSITAMAPNLPMGGLMLLQHGTPAEAISPSAQDPQCNADNIKAASYYLGADAVGVSRCPDWAYYSHDATGKPIKPYHEHAISFVIDQGHETMDGASGDDWIACAQSMRAYQRFALLGAVLAKQIRNLGFEARVHSANDGEVLQPPLMLLAGLGEVSRIGEVILNPFLGPRLKSGVITTNMPVEHDKPINFGLQNFCNHCNKCARECPSGAITAGPKLMFNGYEIWKSDSEKCTRYRTTNTAGSMCGRCMKTCPWNLEGVFKERPFRWLAMKVPWAAKLLAKLDDKVGNGDINPVKNWWWDLEMLEEGAYKPPQMETSKRGLQRDLDLKYEDQTLAVYPANLAPPPYPYPFPMNREDGIAAYDAMITATEYKARLERGKTEGLAHKRREEEGPSPVIQVKVSKTEPMCGDISKYELIASDGESLPKFEAGAHVDVVVAPEYFRQYSLSGDPADTSTYQIGVLREDEGRGGSRLLHRIFKNGRRLFISRPKNHFPLIEEAKKSYLMAGGIGITPMIAMAHRLYHLGKEFELHYSCKSRSTAGFLKDIEQAPWHSHVRLHFSDEGSRINLPELLAHYEQGYHLYTCGPDRYMTAVLEAGQQNGWDDKALHREYFSAPETGDYINQEFTLRLTKSDTNLIVPQEKSATEVLQEAGFHVDTKCSEGICGVCAADLVNGEVEHRDFVLSQKEREQRIILCCSRAAEENGVIEVAL